MTYSRRYLGRIALSALPARQLLARPSSKFGGVQIGVIVSPVALSDLPLHADQLLEYLVRLGINAVELQDVRVESYAGAPTAVRRPATGEARRQAARQLTDWRASASMDKYHDRITCLHLKDRKFGIHGGQNVPWGDGDTPLKEILLAMQRGKYRFPAAIEMEYGIPPGSTSMAELSKCLKFCQDVLA